MSVRMGVYCFQNEDGIAFVGYSQNLDGTRKRLLFELRCNACPYRALQEFYNENNGLTFSILEEYTPAKSESDLETEAHLWALAIKHKTKLHATSIQTQV